MDKIILGAYCLICIGLFMYWRKHSRAEAWIKLCWVTFMPLLGFLVLLYRWKSREEQDFEVHLPVFDQVSDRASAGVSIYRSVDIQKEVNIVPIEEALIINSTETKRKILIDALKEDTIEYMHILEQAVRNEDTETSHYAATAVVEMKRQLTLALQEFAVKYEENKQDGSVLMSYADVLKQFLHSGFLDERTKHKYKHTYSQVLADLLNVCKDEEQYFQDKIRCDLELGAVEQAKAACAKFEKAFPQSENVALMYIEFYFMTRNKEGLASSLQKLKQLPVRLSNHALNQIRLWSQEV